MPAKPKNGTLTGLTVPAVELGEMFGVTRETVIRWASKEGMPRVAEGKYPVTDCVRWRIDKLRAEAVSQESTDIQEERRKLIVAQRQAQELENDEARGQLIPADMVGTAMNQLASAVATQLDGLAARVTPRVVQLRDPGQVQRVLFDECRLIRSAAAAAFERIAADWSRSEDPEPATEAERGRVGRRPPRAAAGQPGAGAVAD